MRALVFLSALGVASAAIAQAPPQRIGEEATEIEEVTVTARKVNLNLTVGGDVDPTTMVTSAPVGMFCGGGQYRFQRWGTFDQCWINVKPDREVLLIASREGRHRVDWTVNWTGCEPFGDGAGCRLFPTGDAVIAAEFHRLGKGG